MIAQLFLTALLGLAGLYAWTAFRKTPQIAAMVGSAALAGLYFTWFQSQATWLAEKIGIGRGVDLILYVWVVLSLLAILHLHLAIKAQTEIITTLVRRLAISEADKAAPPS